MGLPPEPLHRKKNSKVIHGGYVDNYQIWGLWLDTTHGVGYFHITKLAILVLGPREKSCPTGEKWVPWRRTA